MILPISVGFIMFALLITTLVLLALIYDGNQKVSCNQHSDHDSGSSQNPNRGGCKSTRYGCCRNGKGRFPADEYGNCIMPKRNIGGCAGTKFGCCPNNVTPRMDSDGSNC